MHLQFTSIWHSKDLEAYKPQCGRLSGKNLDHSLDFPQILPEVQNKK